MLEPYLYKSSKAVWKYVVTIRWSNYRLSIEKGRYNGIERNLQHCHLCNMDILGDEYRAFQACSNPDSCLLSIKVIVACIIL